MFCIASYTHACQVPNSFVFDVCSVEGRSFAGLKVVFLLRLVLTTIECSVRGGGLHGLDLRFLLV